MGCSSAKAAGGTSQRSLLSGGQVHSSTSLGRRERSLPSHLAAAPRGSFQSALPPVEEGRRDFARIFFANERKIFLIGKGMPSMRPLQPTTGPSSAHIGDLSDPVIDRAEALFGEALFQQLNQVCSAGGRKPPDREVLHKLRSRAVLAMTVNVGIDFALQMKLLPTFLQPFFLIVVMDSPLEARAATYGFVAELPNQISGDRPDSKRTPFCVRLLSPDLLGDSSCGKDGAADNCWEVQYSVREVNTTTIFQAVEEEMQTLREATGVSNWDLM